MAISRDSEQMSDAASRDFRRDFGHYDAILPHMGINARNRKSAGHLLFSVATITIAAYSQADGDIIWQASDAYITLLNFLPLPDLSLFTLR